MLSSTARERYSQRRLSAGSTMQRSSRLIGMGLHSFREGFQALPHPLLPPITRRLHPSPTMPYRPEILMVGIVSPGYRRIVAEPTQTDWHAMTMADDS